MKSDEMTSDVSAPTAREVEVRTRLSSSLGANYPAGVRLCGSALRKINAKFERPTGGAQRTDAAGRHGPWRIRLRRRTLRRVRSGRSGRCDRPAAASLAAADSVELKAQRLRFAVWSLGKYTLKKRERKKERKKEGRKVRTERTRSHDRGALGTQAGEICCFVDSPGPSWCRSEPRNHGVTERSCTAAPLEGHTRKDRGGKLNAVAGFIMDKGSPKVSGSKCHPPWTLPQLGTSSV
ncbi:unnamed protein product [Pleuronectes platessa]|uniref:Uncharacterized protein n=1 Tax=Pleuronectes platessa TaxID=8262 RepID=A0A9N7Y3B0_PLEPL|nr:unnamed protein product [Pleuronectes platessa]